jgi:putative methionine-R-sulfoxide reductase with GAF domain/streptogramin lyase
MKKIAILLLFLNLADALYSQLPEYHAQVFGEEQGLESDLINEVFIDKREFVWVTTNSALQRFDGRDVKRYPFQDFLTHALCSEDGEIWVEAGQRLWRNRKDWKGFEQVPFDTSGGVRLRGIFQIFNSPIRVLTTQGLYEWIPDTHQFKKQDLKIPVAGLRQSGTRMDTCGNVFFYPYTGGICALDLKSGQYKTLPFNREFSHLFAVTPELAVVTDYLENSYWYDFKCGEIRYIDAKEYGLSEEFHKINIFGFAQVSENMYLVNTKFGLCEFDISKDHFTVKAIYVGGKPLENNQILRRIFLDNHGVIWAHSMNNLLAINRLENSIGLLRNYHYDPPNQWNDRTYGITEDPKGNLWLGSVIGFKKLNLKTGIITGFSHTEGARDVLSHPFVRGMSSDDKYIFLGPTFNGIWLFDPVRETYRRPVYANDTVHQKLEGDYIDYIGKMRNGDHLVCGRFWIYCIKANTYKTEFIRFDGDKSNMNTVTQDSKGRIWFGSERGIFCLDENYHLISTKGLLNTESINFIFENTENELLVATAKGLRRVVLGQDEIKVDTIPSPLEGVGIGSLFRDSLNRYWMGTYDGLYLADRDLKIFQKFDFSDNIQSYYFNPGSVFRASNGMLFMGGQNGINYFYPEKMEREERPLSVSIQSMRINDGDSTLLWPTGPLRFPHNLNTITFEIVAPYYNNAGRIQYRYRLEQGPWIETGNSFRLPKLPPEKYRLEIAASVTGQQWFESNQVLEFTILPPFWQTWTFRLITTIVIAALLIGMIRYFENRERKKQQSKLELEKLKNTNLQYQLETEKIINYFSRSMDNKNNVDEILWDIVEQCISHLGWEDCVIYLLDPARKVLIQKAAWGNKSSRDQKIVSPIEIYLGQGIVGNVAKSGKAELIEDTSKDSRYIKDDEMRLSELAVPIISEGQVIGVIDTENSRKNFYTPWHLQILKAIAALCGQKIALSKSEEARHNALLQVVDNQRKAAESKLQSLRLQMNPHFLFNALNSIQQMTMTGNGDGAALYLSKFSKLLRMVLKHSDHDHISLREELEILQLYVELESLRFDDTFTYTITCEPGLDKEEFNIPPLLIQPFVENAIWHGLLYKEGKRNLKVVFETNENEDLVCMIEDNGIGRHASQSYHHNSQRTGKGLSVSEERLQTINKQLHQNNQLKIEDLYYENGRPAGTRIVITFA